MHDARSTVINDKDVGSMKKYIIALFVLVIVGIVLAYITFKQSAALDDEVYLETTASIRNLKLLNNTVNNLIVRIRYQNTQRYATLEELSTNINDEFDNLRFEALFEEIELSSELVSATTGVEQALGEKINHIEKFIHQHKSSQQAQIKLTNYIQGNTDFLNTKKRSNIDNLIDITSISFYQFAQNVDELNNLNKNIERVKQAITSISQEDQIIIQQYLAMLDSSVSTTNTMHNAFSAAVNQATSERFNVLEFNYVNFHNLAIEESKKLRTILIIYGFILLSVLVYLAYLFWRQYINLEQQVIDRTQEISEAYKNLKESQEQLIQSEKMASLGEMVAGVAHEINTPLGYVNSNVDTVKNNLSEMDSIIGNIDLAYKEAVSPQRDQKKISTLISATLRDYAKLHIGETFEESSELLEDSQHGLSEISKLVSSLKDFARLDRQAVDQVNIHDCIENSLKIASNPIKESNIIIQRQYAELPYIHCMPSKLNQLFLNIINNAAHAMKQQGGELHISTQTQGNHIEIRFKDDGIGMNDDIQQKMFDPFFTSKPIGEGTGLGMSIAYKIVQAHHGEIQVESSPGEGTTMIVILPINHTA